MPTQITATQQIEILPPTATDKRGNPTTVQNPVLSSSDPTVLTVNDNGDGSGLALAAGPVGAASILFAADADLGEGVVPIEGSAEIEVKAGNAAIVNMNLGAVTEQPDAPTP